MDRDVLGQSLAFEIYSKWFISSDNVQQISMNQLEPMNNVNQIAKATGTTTTTKLNSN